MQARGLAGPPATIALLLLLAAFALAGCSGTERIGATDRVTVYVSLPLRGPSGAEGRDAADGARLALAEAGGAAGGREVRAVFLDDTEAARWSPARVGRNARRATRDASTIAYIGELESGATRTSLPITNEARILQVSPGSAAADLVREPGTFDGVPEHVQPSGERSFGRVIPSDVARAPTQLPPAGRRFARRFRDEHGREPGRDAAYGYEAMAVVLDSIERAGEAGAGREAVIDAFFATVDRDSVLGTYSIDRTGETTLGRTTGSRIDRGRARPVSPLDSPGAPRR